MCKTRGISWLAEETVTFERRLSRFGVGCKSGQVQFKYRSDNSNERGNWSNLKIIQKIPEQHNGKARNQGATEKKKTILSTARILREILMSNYETFSPRNNITCST